MRSRTGPLWRSWIAALCVALMAFATLESVSAAHAADICEQASVTTLADIANANIVDDGADQDDSRAPGAPTQQGHHCCAAHNGTTPALAAASAPTQIAQTLLPAHANDDARDRAPQGLERPPRNTAIV